MKIYYQYSSVDKIMPVKGDFINELNTIRALAEFAEVYFAGRLYEPDNPNFFSLYHKLDIRDADFVWIRASQPTFNLAVHFKKPVCWMASPYNEYAFRKASFIACFSKKWEQNLKKGVTNHLNPSGIRFRNALNVGQTVTDEFVPLPTSIKSQQIRADLNAEFVVGCFGRIVKSNYPALLISCIPELSRRIPGIKFIFGCTNQGVIPDNLPNVVFTNFSHADMPYALSACDVTFTGATGSEWDFCGSLKLIEAAACGVPFICQHSDARIELSGIDYPFYLPESAIISAKSPQSKRLLINLILNIYMNPAIGKSWGDILAKRARKQYCLNSQSNLLKRIIIKYL